MPQLPQHDPSVYRTADENAYISQMAGFDYNGTQCSATRDDQNGLTAVYMAIAEGWITSTLFRFENGSTLTLDTANYQSFATAFSAFRNSFFQ